MEEGIKKNIFKYYVYVIEEKYQQSYREWGVGLLYFHTKY